MEDQDAVRRLAKTILAAYGYHVLDAANGYDALDIAQHYSMFTSGYTSDIIAHRGVLEYGVTYIPKPFSPHDLASKVREVLNEPGTPR